MHQESDFTVQRFAVRHFPKAKPQPQKEAPQAQEEVKAPKAQEESKAPKAKDKKAAAKAIAAAKPATT